MYTDPKTGLMVRNTVIEYADYPTVEWTLDFKNTGDKDTPIIGGIQPLDTSFVHPTDGEFSLHSIKGDSCTPDSYQPFAEFMPAGYSKRMASQGGRPTNGNFPYWNIATGDGGYLAVLGWPGQWSAQFERATDNVLRIHAGQELTHFTLHPGEEVRSPLAVLQFYQGHWIRGQNLWRRWMVAHNLPRPGGKLVPTHYAACFGTDLVPTAADELSVIDGFQREGIQLDYWILDSGWFPGRGNWFENTGSWEVDTQRFPKGVREVSDRSHANGMDFVLWFEPERAWSGTWLALQHPEWILGGANGGLVNLGNREAWKWVVERIDSLINSEGVDVYRQDFNIDPLGFWRGADTEDRQGISEIAHVDGYLKFWRELLRRHPKLWIDSCASGGRRNDLETMRLSVPLLRSDYFSEPESQQCQTYGLSLWLPYYGSGLGTSGTYWFRSCIFPASRVGWDTRKTDLDYPLLKRMLAEYRKVQPYLLGDYYPLTPYSLDKHDWIAWQFDDPELGGGMVQAFRRDACEDDSLTLQLGGLDADSTYAVENLDTDKTEKRTGRELTEQGLRVTITNRPGSALLAYRKACRY
jgi:alpha-galactosidase